MPPLFDRVDGNSNEPPEHLKNASPAEINQYWMEREKKIREEQNQPPSNLNPQQPPNAPPPTAPAGMTAGQAATMISGAKMVAKEGKEYWQRFLPEVESIMGQMSASQQMDAGMWNTVYEKVVGMHMQELLKEAKDSAMRPPSMESSAPSTPPSTPRQLSVNEQHVVDELRRAGATAIRKDAQGVPHQVPFDSEAYITADERRQKGILPLTWNNF